MPEKELSAEPGVGEPSSSKELAKTQPAQPHVEPMQDWPAWLEKAEKLTLEAQKAEKAERDVMARAKAKADEEIAAAHKEMLATLSAADAAAAQADAEAAAARSESRADASIGSAQARVEAADREVAAASEAVAAAMKQAGGEVAASTTVNSTSQPVSAKPKSGGLQGEQSALATSSKKAEDAWTAAQAAKEAARVLYAAKVRKARADAEKEVAIAAKETHAKVAAMRQAMAEAQSEMIRMETMSATGNVPRRTFHGGGGARASNQTLAKSFDRNSIKGLE
eukprot:scaffold44068_cov24-Tisochrysis_lutea.AAC.1